MTRKRNKEPLTRIMREPCAYCEGEGYMISRQSICYRIFREVLRDSHDMVGDQIAVRVNPAIAELLHGEESELIAALEKLTERHIVIYPNAAFHLEEVNIIEILKSENEDEKPA